MSRHLCESLWRVLKSPSSDETTMVNEIDYLSDNFLKILAFFLIFFVRLRFFSAVFTLDQIRYQITALQVLFELKHKLFE